MIITEILESFILRSLHDHFFLNNSIRKSWRMSNYLLNENFSTYTNVQLYVFKHILTYNLKSVNATVIFALVLATNYVEKLRR